MKNNHKIVLSLSAAAGILALIFVAGTLSSKPEGFWAKRMPTPHTRLDVQAVDMVWDADFCGEKVKLNDPEVYERFDRELMVNTYMQSSTLLYLKLSKRWFPVIEPILERNNIPDDFKYLCVAESGLQNVISPSKAEGFWQFLEATGKEYSLEINSEVDERYNLELATQAACDYFNAAYTKFGNWTQVAASYNMGQGGLTRALADQWQSDYYELQLSRETMRYLLRIVALKEIMKDPAKYGYNLRPDDYYAPLNYTTDFISTPINWVSYANSKGISYKDLKYLNPWIQSTNLANTKKKTYIVKLPN